MIMLAKDVSYDGNAVRYALDKEKAKVVKVNHIPEGISPTAIWYMMKHHCQLHQQDRTEVNPESWTQLKGSLHFCPFISKLVLTRKAIRTNNDLCFGLL